LAWIAFKKGQFDVALERSQKASEMIPDEAIVYEHLGDIYSAKNNKDKALEFYKKASTLAKGKDQEIYDQVEQKLASLIKSDSMNLRENRVPSTEKK
jgi:tetratricopeptide (TPR) repeat protein